jgi:hypothetical protein
VPVTEPVELEPDMSEPDVPEVPEVPDIPVLLQAPSTSAHARGMVHFIMVFSF